MDKHYPTDLTDKEWGMIQPFFNQKAHRGGRPYVYSRRQIVNAIFYILRAGCAWRLLPNANLFPTQVGRGVPFRLAGCLTTIASFLHIRSLSLYHARAIRVVISRRNATKTV